LPDTFAIGGRGRANIGGMRAIPIRSLRLTLASAMSGWMWLLPRLAFLAFVAALGALLWISQRSEQEQQRATLISDVLWLEQDLRFHLTHNEELLGRITPPLAASAETFEVYARTLLGNGSGLRQILWLDATGKVVRALPAPTDAYMVGEAQGSVPSMETFRLARALGRPSYSTTYAIAQEDWQFEVHVPSVQGGQLSGMAVGAYSLRQLLKDSIPWWLAERYRIAILDSAASTIATRSKVEPVDASGSYEIPFEPPGHGLALQAWPYVSPKPLTGHLLGGALVILAILMLWSLWALRRHVHGRLVAEAALREEHAFRKAMEDSLQTGMRARDLDGRITYVNPAFCRMVGWPAEQLIGRVPPMPYWPDEYLDETRAIHDRILSGEGPGSGFELKFKRANGEVFDVLIHEAPLIDSRGRQTGWMGSLVDISERRRAEELDRQRQERLQATSRLVAMGEMASSLAHELNQPLAAIASYTAGSINLIDSGKATGADLKPALAKCAEQAQRAGRIIRRIYEFARRAEPKSERCDLLDILDEVLMLVEPDARRHRIRIVRDTTSRLPPIQGDRVLLAQALLNLLRNGIDAMNGVSDPRRIVTVAVTPSDGMIRIAIGDRGEGVPANVLPHLFEPFFTTKTEGMGMGLNICRSVVEAHRGRLWYEPNPAGGSIFHIDLPMPETL